jgi:mRNA-degrading endonuclease RelE of RelBE toxin-antitoxin system
MYEIKYSPGALKDLENLPKIIAQKIFNTLHEFKEIDSKTKNNLFFEPLEGFPKEKLFKTRIGSYRAVFKIFHDEKIVYIILIDNRRVIYRRLKKMLK